MGFLERFLCDPDIKDIIRLKLSKKVNDNINLKDHLRLDRDSKPSIGTAIDIMNRFGAYFNGWAVVVDAHEGSPGAFIFHPDEVRHMQKSIYDYGENIYHNSDENYTHYSLHVIFDGDWGTCDVIEKLIEITNKMDAEDYTLHEALTEYK